jgi:hypothetical protein
MCPSWYALKFPPASWQKAHILIEDSPLPVSLVCFPQHLHE